LPDNIGKASVRSTQRLEQTGGKRRFPYTTQLYLGSPEKRHLGLIENWPLPAYHSVIWVRRSFKLRYETQQHRSEKFFAGGYVKKKFFGLVRI
jgi:hypothetical protein